MDLSDALKATSISTESNDTNPAEDSLIVPALSKRDQFFATYKHQSFSFPDSVMFYMAKNPTTPELYQKLVESCKYSFVKNPILVASDLCFENGQWEINRKPYDLDKFLYQFWITDEFSYNVKHSDNVNQNIISSIIPKLYRCNAKRCTLINQTISFQDLSFLISSAEKISFDKVTVKDKNGSNAAVEKIVEIAVNAKWIKLQEGNGATSKTMTELIKIPHFSTLDFFLLVPLSDDFDIEAFYAYMKKNQQTSFIFNFGDSISDAYKYRINQIVDEILETNFFDYRPPFIAYDGMEKEKSDHLCDVFCFH